MDTLPLIVQQLSEQGEARMTDQQFIFIAGLILLAPHAEKKYANFFGALLVILGVSLEWAKL